MDARGSGEIPHIERDRVTSLDFRPWVNKRLPDAWDSVVYEIGRIDLERVDADHYEGWNVAPGRIAYSHSGYLTGAAKTAFASGLRAAGFQVLRASGGEPVLRKKVMTERTRLGEFQVFDFSEVRTPGVYVLRAGGGRNPPLPHRRRRVGRLARQDRQLLLRRALRHVDSPDARVLPPRLAGGGG